MVTIQAYLQLYEICNKHELYIRAFNILNNQPAIHTLDDEAVYSRLLRNLLDDHTHVVTQLAAGFKECRKHIQVLIRIFSKSFSFILAFNV